MNRKILIKNAQLINEGVQFATDILIDKGRFERIDPIIDVQSDIEIAADGLWALPGIIDDQVHFREPGYPHKACIASEAKAGLLGGVTSFMEMPNTRPPAVTQQQLEEKYEIAAHSSLANYSFYMGATNDNIEEVLRTDGERICGIKIFMGSSTGNMLVDNEQALEKLFAKVPLLIATHCEDEGTIRQNTAAFIDQFGKDIPISSHPLIRSWEACMMSSSHAIELATRHNTRLHILHISTLQETELFSNKVALTEKRITSEVCVHHLHFDATQYDSLGTKIKCNPAIKAPEHKAALWQALAEDRFDVIATDHAPHTWEEKQNPYLQAPSGLPLLQHSLNLMLHYEKMGKISLSRIVEKMCHAPADCFRIRERGYVREGYWADLVLVHPHQPWTVNKENIAYQCSWSPLEGMQFDHRVVSTLVSGHLAYHQGKLDMSKCGQRLLFDL